MQVLTPTVECQSPCYGSDQIKHSSNIQQREQFLFLLGTLVEDSIISKLFSSHMKKLSLGD